MRQHTVAPKWSVKSKSMTKERVDWIAIGKALSRVPANCRKKWADLKIRGTAAAAFCAPMASHGAPESDPHSESDAELELVLSGGGTASAENTTRTETPNSKNRVRWTPAQV